MTKIDVSGLGRIQETLLITLWARATESQHEVPILRDPRAEEILRSIDYDFDRFQHQTVITQPTACVRATVFDRWVRQFMAEHPGGVVVEIGAGLDTRFERLDDGKVRWFDLDTPDSMAVRRKFFRETERRRFLQGSVLDPGWVAAVQETESKNYFFIAEGVLLYFTEAEVKRLLALLTDHFPGSLFAFDSCDRLIQRFSRRLEGLKSTKAEFRWGIDNIRRIEKWDSRYKVIEVDCAMNHHRNRYPWVFRLFTVLFPRLRRLFAINLVRLG